MGARGPKPGFKKARAAAALGAAAAVAAAAAAAGANAAAQAPQAAAPRRVDPLERSRDIRSMPYDELKVYAAQIGVPRRDIEHLTEDRLRQNCALTVHAVLEAITD